MISGATPHTQDSIAIQYSVLLAITNGDMKKVREKNLANSEELVNTKLSFCYLLRWSNYLYCT